MRHSLMTGAQIHVPFAYEYADATARAAATGFTVDDVGKFAHQLDNHSIWMLTDNSPETWIFVSLDIESLTEELTPTTGDMFVMSRAGALYKVDADNLPGGGGGGGGSPWTNVANEDGTSFASFTGVNGTWSSDGTVIKQTDTSAAPHRAKLNTSISKGAIFIFEADIQQKNSGTALSGLLIGWDGSSTGSPVVYLRDDTNQVTLELDSASTVQSFSATIAVDTWYHLKLIVAMDRVEIYLDGTKLGTVAQFTANNSYIGLWNYGTETWFKNIKANNLTDPA